MLLEQHKGEHSRRAHARRSRPAGPAEGRHGAPRFHGKDRKQRCEKLSVIQRALRYGSARPRRSGTLRLKRVALERVGKGREKERSGPSAVPRPRHHVRERAGRYRDRRHVGCSGPGRGAKKGGRSGNGPGSGAPPERGPESGAAPAASARLGPRPGLGPGPARPPPASVAPHPPPRPTPPSFSLPPTTLAARRPPAAAHLGVRHRAGLAALRSPPLRFLPRAPAPPAFTSFPQPAPPQGTMGNAPFSPRRPPRPSTSRGAAQSFEPRPAARSPGPAVLLSFPFLFFALLSFPLLSFLLPPAAAARPKMAAALRER